MPRHADYRETKPWTPSSSYLVIACLHERLLPGRGEARSGACTRPTPHIHGAKIYGIELNGIKAAMRSCGEIRTARPTRCAARVRHLMMLAFPVFDFPSSRALTSPRLPLFVQSRIRMTDISRITKGTAKILFPSNVWSTSAESSKRISNTLRLWERLFWFLIFFWFHVLLYSRFNMQNNFYNETAKKKWFK